MAYDGPPEHLHLLDSFAVGWRGVNLIYELEPQGEMAEAQLSQHCIVIAQGDFRASFWMGHTWQHVDYAKGDIGIVPATQPFPLVQVDREVPLLELFVDPTLTPVVLEPQWNLHDPLIQQMGLALKSELQTNGKAGALYAESMAIALSAHLARHYGAKTPVNGANRLSQHQLQTILDYIHAHLDQPLTVDCLGQIAQLSSHHFATCFKRSLGRTPHQYITQCRMDRAKQLLKQSNLSIVEIALQVGFQNQSHFTRTFRQHTQTTPRQYRYLL